MMFDWLGREKPANLCKHSNVSFISDALLRTAVAHAELKGKFFITLCNRLHNYKLLASTQGNY